MVRFKSLLLAGFLIFAGAVLVSNWPLLRAQIAAAFATDANDRRAQSFDRLDRDVLQLEQVLSVVKRTIKLAAPFVVHIEAKKHENASRGGRSRTVEEDGAGIILLRDRKYYVLTNRHVIQNAQKRQITIELEDGRRLHPKEILTDADTDMAVLALSADELTPARIGNSNDVEVGDFVLAIGSPFGLSWSASHGMVSAKGRRDLKLGGETLKYQDFIQTDAAINPGNSGGPLLNLRGEVIGLNTAIASASGVNEGVGFCIPINMAMFVARQLIDHGVVRRAKLGVSLDREFDAKKARLSGLKRLRGTRLTSVEEGSPAGLAGMRRGDVILEFDGVGVDSDVHLVNLVSMTPIDRVVPIVILREGRRMRVKCKLIGRSNYSRLRRKPVRSEDELAN